MRFGTTCCSLALVFGSCLAAYTAPQAPKKPTRAAEKATPAARAANFARVVAPLVARYCGGCHGEKVQTAGVVLTKFRDEAAVVKDRMLWEKVAQSVSSGHMPPKGVPAPTQAERAKIAGWIEAKMAAADCDLRDPGRVTLRRLNRAEYHNTVRDLLGVNFRPADDFPSDDVGYGFDNIGDVLTLSPILMEKYLAAAEKIARAAIVAPDPEGPATRFEAERLPLAPAMGDHDGYARVLAGAAELSSVYEAATEGEYLLRARAFGQQAGPEPAKMAFRLAGKDVSVVDVPVTSEAPRVYSARVRMAAGRWRVAVAFVNDYYKPDDPNPAQRDRNLVVDYFEVVGPLPAAPNELPESHKRIFIAQLGPNLPEREAARKILTGFARRAYRRPVADAEADRLLRYVDLARREGESFERGIQLAVQAVLVSPHFLFRVEMDPKGAVPGKPYPVADYELASRLSYFLWSSMPDEELFRLAGSGQLRNPEVLSGQVKRLLADSKAEALVENFAGQWLQLRNLAQSSPDPKRFPAWNDALRRSMRRETELFFQSIMREDRSVLEFLDAKFTFLNEALAKHYGIPGVTGEQFRKVALADARRGGILGQASILTITSNPTRTSPVKRGKWVLEQILGTPPPPPPPDVPELKAEEGMLTGTLRRKMEQHRKDPVCGSCHARLDPLGFGLENYDAIGAWRDQDGGQTVDASGTLPDGKSFSGPAGLKQVLKGKKELFVRNLAAQLLTFALGRGLEAADRCAVDEIAAAAAKGSYRFSTLVTEIVRSEPLRLRRAEVQGE